MSSSGGNGFFRSMVLTQSRSVQPWRRVSGLRPALLLLALAAVVALGVAAREANAQGASPKSTAAPAGDTKKGKQLYASDGCFECHGSVGQGTSAGLRIGPPRLSFEALSRYVRQPTGQMPPYTAKVLSEAELADVYAFLQSVPEPPKNIPLLK